MKRLGGCVAHHLPAAAGGIELPVCRSTATSPRVAACSQRRWTPPGERPRGQLSEPSGPGTRGCPFVPERGEDISCCLIP